MMRIKGFAQNNRCIFAAFLLPVLLAVIALAAEGVYPFGDNQIAVIDMYHQYVPFLSELQYKLQEGGSLFYTWNGAGGSNFWNLMAYYGASPLNLILALFPRELIMEGVTVILLIKIGLAGSFMALYLRYACGRNDMVTAAFATMYALCSYVMAYYWCIMWMDAVALLPLCILGLCRIIDGKGPVLYTVSLALIVFINYYTAIMVCIFILFYYPALYFIKVRGGGALKCLKTTGKAVGFSLLAIAMASVMLLPTYISMQSTYYISAEMPDNWLFYNDVLEVLNQLLPNSQLTYREGLPNLYCGLLTVLLLVFYCMSRSISLREKAINGAFLVFMFLSLNINKLDFIWHGFHFPNQLPYRYTFVICFLLTAMAFKAFLRIDEVSLKTLWTVLAAGIGYYILAQRLLGSTVDDKEEFFYLGTAWLAMYCIIMILYKKRIVRRKVFLLLTVFVIAAEMSVSAATSVDKIGTTSRETYFTNSEDVWTLAGEANKEFVRTEMDANYLLNNPAFYHYRGISQFSSSLNANATALMEKIGIEGEPGKNRYNYNLTDPVTDAILNVKYIICKNLPLDNDNFILKERSGNSYLYENRYPLSIGYMTGNEIITWDTESEDPFTVLEDYVRAATGNRSGKVFRSLEMDEAGGANAETSVDGHGIVSAVPEDEETESSVELIYTARESGQHYVFVEAGGADSITVKREDKVKDMDIRSDCGSIVDIGDVEEGEMFRIEIKYGEGTESTVKAHVCTVDTDVWESAYDILSSCMMTVGDWGDTYIEGSIEAEEDGVFVTSVPYEEGWTLTVDGEEREIDQLVGGVFIAAHLDEGSHDIRLSFRPPGLMAAVMITAASILLLAAFCLVQRRGRRRKAGAEAEEVTISTEPQAPSEPEPSYGEVSGCNTVSEGRNPQEGQRGS